MQLLALRLKFEWLQKFLFLLHFTSLKSLLLPVERESHLYYLVVQDHRIDVTRLFIILFDTFIFENQLVPELPPNMSAFKITTPKEATITNLFLAGVRTD